jgi:hypothetical protein
MKIKLIFLVIIIIYGFGLADSQPLNLDFDLEINFLSSTSVLLSWSIDTSILNYHLASGNEDFRFAYDYVEIVDTVGLWVFSNPLEPFPYRFFINYPEIKDQRSVVVGGLKPNTIYGFSITLMMPDSTVLIPDSNGVKSYSTFIQNIDTSELNWIFSDNNLEIDWSESMSYNLDTSFLKDPAVQSIKMVLTDTGFYDMPPPSDTIIFAPNSFLFAGTFDIKDLKTIISNLFEDTCCYYLSVYMMVGDSSSSGTNIELIKSIDAIEVFINDAPSAPFHVYPNPSNDNISIKMLANEYIDDISIYNLKGQLIKKIRTGKMQRTFKIDYRLIPGMFSSGTYIIIANSHNKIFKKKISFLK